MPHALLDRREQERLTTALITRYAGVHNPERVRKAVAEVYARYADARIQTYVPVLAERAVRELLQMESEDPETP